MFGKGIGYFLLLVLLVDPSSAFLSEKCNDLINIDLGRFQKLLKEGKVCYRLVLKAATILLGIFKENPDLAKEYTSIKEFLELLVRQGSKIISAANLAYFGATVYLAAVILTSYCFLVHSQEQFAEVRVIGKKLDVIIDGEIKPILEYINMLLTSDKENACNMKMREMLNDRKMKIQNIVHEVGNRTKKNIRDKEQSRVLQMGSVAVACIGVVAAPIALPSALGVSLVAGTFGAAGAIGYDRFGESKLTYEKTLEPLKKMEDKAFQAEQAITMLQTYLSLACRHGLKKIESGFKWSERLMLEDEEQKETGEEWNKLEL